MAKITVVARIEAEEDKVEFVKSELLKLIEPTKQDEGFIQYDLHQDNENPAVFIFYENWASEKLLEKHLGTEHLGAYVKATEGCIVSFTINKMTVIS